MFTIVCVCGCRCLSYLWVDALMFNNASGASTTHSLVCVCVCVSLFVCVCVCVHLWADDSLDALQGCVRGGGRAVRCGSCWAVAMVTMLPLTHRYMGQVTLEGERKSERQVKRRGEDLPFLPLSSSTGGRSLKPDYHFCNTCKQMCLDLNSACKHSHS